MEHPGGQRWIIRQPTMRPRESAMGSSIPSVPWAARNAEGNVGPWAAGTIAADDAKPARELRRLNPRLVALLAPLARYATILSIPVSFAAFTLMMPWQVSLVVVFCLCCHEYGHVWAMRRRGIPSKGFYLIPFVGGVAIPSRPISSRSEEAFIASMGPIFGLAAAPLGFVLAYLVTRSVPNAAAATEWVVAINLFNLLPLFPLDGGRMVWASAASFGRMIGIALLALGAVGALVLAFRTQLRFLVVVAILGVSKIRREWRRDGGTAPLSKWRATGWLGAYLGLVIAGTILVGVFGVLARNSPMFYAHHGV
ncbi:MAG: hypothetical protein KGI51_13560 [Rhodospirillales bacterium]|nr:hypothetical protein [Rhodospirillales bacterium]